MGKNILQNYNAETKNNVAIACALLMLVGFLMSRAMLSLGTVAFGINAFIGVHPKEWLKNKWWLWGMAWVGVYIISGLWSDNIPQWNERVSVKLPMLLLPLAFGLLKPFTEKQLKAFTIGGLVVFMGSMFYSMYFLLSDPAYYIEQYRFSKVLPTLGGHDYIRYSLSISLFIIWCFYVLHRFPSKVLNWVLVVSIALLILYVHIIAVKTGILVLYLFLFMMAIRMAFKRQPLVGIALLASVVLIPIAAYKYVPTFEKKVDYFTYSWGVFAEGKYDSNYSDIGRLVSYDIALKLLPEYAIAGTGIGDMHDVMNTGYDKWYPGVPDFQRLKPHNQFLIVALGCGIPALIIFLVWVFYPLRWVNRTREGFFLLATWVVLWIPLMVEPTLELQYGVYVYLFFLLLMVHGAQHSKRVETNVA